MTLFPFGMTLFLFYVMLNSFQHLPFTQTNLSNLDSSVFIRNDIVSIGMTLFLFYVMLNLFQHLHFTQTNLSNLDSSVFIRNDIVFILRHAELVSASPFYSNKSFQSGFICFTRLFFHSLCQFFNCFSLAIAICMSLHSSK